MISFIYLIFSCNENVCKTDFGSHAELSELEKRLFREKHIVTAITVGDARFFVTNIF